MTSTEKGDVSFAELSLEPIVGDEPLALALKITPGPAAKSHSHARSKTRTDRRVVADRREEIRFETDRRSGKERRPKSSWESGKII